MDNNITRPSSNAAVTFAAFLIIIGVVMYASSIITPVLLAIFITIVCAQPIRWLESKKVPNGLAVALVLMSILGILLGLGEVIGRSIVKFSNNSAIYAQRLNEIMSSLFSTLHGMGFDMSVEKLESYISPNSIMNLSASFLGAIGSLMSNMFLIIFILIFMLLELNSFNLKIKAITSTTDGAISYFKRIEQSIRQYLGLTTIVSLLTGVVVYFALIIIGVDYAIMWALLAFMFNFIPNIGSIVASIPAIVFAAIQLGTGGAIWTAVSYVAINMIVGNVIQPPLMGKGLGLSTLVVFISLIFWGYLLGTVGMFLSVPLTMVVKIVLEQKESTRWIAIMLGTDNAAREIIDQSKSKLNES
ncbi:MAG: AI-2E family transporter [Bacteroidetes bacterium]|nr:AI-2E family transporter [Bacteroidota bacterium]